MLTLGSGLGDELLDGGDADDILDVDVELGSPTAAGSVNTGSGSKKGSSSGTKKKRRGSTGSP